MKNNDLILIALAVLGLMMYSKSKAATGKGPTTPTSPKPAQTGASNATVAQYWSSLYGPAVGAAVAANAPMNQSTVSNMTDEQAWSAADAGGWM